MSDEVPHAVALGVEVVLVVLVGGDADGELLHHIKPVAGETYDFARIIGEEA